MLGTAVGTDRLVGHTCISTGYTSLLAKGELDTVCLTLAPRETEGCRQKSFDGKKLCTQNGPQTFSNGRYHTCATIIHQMAEEV